MRRHYIASTLARHFEVMYLLGVFQAISSQLPERGRKKIEMTVRDLHVQTTPSATTANTMGLVLLLCELVGPSPDHNPLPPSPPPLQRNINDLGVCITGNLTETIELMMFNPFDSQYFEHLHVYHKVPLHSETILGTFFLFLFTNNPCHLKLLISQMHFLGPNVKVQMV